MGANLVTICEGTPQASGWTRCRGSVTFHVLSQTNLEVLMSLSAHLTELTEKHRSLERKIAEELARPALDDGRLARLKVQKLKLKDEIAKLSRQRTH